jgi:hypothetical protein
MHERTRVDYAHRSLPVEVDAAAGCVGPSAACTSSVPSSPTPSRSAARVQASVARKCECIDRLLELRDLMREERGAERFRLPLALRTTTTSPQGQSRDALLLAGA